MGGEDWEAERRRRVQRGVGGQLYLEVLLRRSGKRGGLRSMILSCNNWLLMIVIIMI